jgi:hypothetical protein
VSTNQNSPETNDGWDIEVPAGWDIVDPPTGVALLALAPVAENTDSDDTDSDDTDSRAGAGADAFRSTLVVTHQPRTSHGEPPVEEVNEYLDMLLDAFEDNLPAAEIIGVWTAGTSEDAPERLATQRVLIGYVAPSADEDGTSVAVDGVEVEMMQQHIWLADEIVTITATVPSGVDQSTIDTLNVCLESLAVAG